MNRRFEEQNKQRREDQAEMNRRFEELGNQIKEVQRSTGRWLSLGFTGIGVLITVFGVLIAIIAI